MTWKLTLETNHQHTSENCLFMTHLKRNVVLRQWFGPIAQQLFKLAKGNLRNNIPTCLQHNIMVDKQAAQHFLIEASFYHQKCLHQFQIIDDLKAKQLNVTQELCELLLYIRMTSHHPSHDSLHIFAECHLPCSLDFDHEIESLIAAKLMQKIEFLHFKFYDKNPYPHDHIFDHQSLTLMDQNSCEPLNNHQILINHQLTT